MTISRVIYSFGDVFLINSTFLNLKQCTHINYNAESIYFLCTIYYYYFTRCYIWVCVCLCVCVHVIGRDAAVSRRFDTFTRNNFIVKLSNLRDIPTLQNVLRLIFVRTDTSDFITQTSDVIILKLISNILLYFFFTRVRCAYEYNK